MRVVEAGDYLVVEPWMHRLPKAHVDVIEYTPGERLVVVTRGGYTITYTRSRVDMRPAFGTPYIMRGRRGG